MTAVEATIKTFRTGIKSLILMLMLLVFGISAYVLIILLALNAVKGMAPYLISLVFLFVSIITTILMLPLIIPVAMYLVKYNKLKIILHNEGLEYCSSKEKTRLLWKEIRYFYFDYLLIETGFTETDKRILLYELGNEKAKIRFNVSPANITDSLQGYTRIGILEKKSARIGTYGLTIDKNEIEEVLCWIKNYTNLEPERKTGLMSRTIQ